MMANYYAAYFAYSFLLILSVWALGSARVAAATLASQNFLLRLSKFSRTKRRRGLDSLPAEVVTSVLLYLEWQDLLQVRATSKRLCEISKLREIWYNLLQQYCIGHCKSVSLEEPLESYSARELERRVNRLMLSEAGWTSSDVSKRYVREIDNVKRADCFCLLPGGRWLLSPSDEGTVMCYDLEFPKIKGKQLTRPQESADTQKVTQISIRVDANSPRLSFELALGHSSFSGSGLPQYPATKLSVWKVAIQGHDAEAELSAQHLRSFYTHAYGKHLCSSIRADQYAWALFTPDELKYYVVVYDWQQSDSLTHRKVVIHPGNTVEFKPLFIELLPNNRLLVLFKCKMMVYDIPGYFNVRVSVEPTAIVSRITPVASLEFPGSSELCRGGISTILTGFESCTFVICTKTGLYEIDLFFTGSEPIVSQILEFESDRLHFSIGFRRAFAFSALFPATAVSISYPTGKGCNGTGCLVKWSCPAYLSPANLPLMDEQSGRVVLHVKTFQLHVIDVGRVLDQCL